MFDGISGGQVAFERAGIDVQRYLASEIDKYAIQVTQDNYPETIQLGDVNLWRDWQLPKIDMVMGGSPCQGFSCAGKRAGTKAVLDGEEYIVSDRDTYLKLKNAGAEFLSQSHLFWEFVLVLDHLKENNPEIHFLLENVKMKKEYQDMISNTLGVHPIEINSMLVGAQSRPRLYWTNIEGIQKPSDKNVTINDILDEDNDKTDLLIKCGAMRGRILENGIRQYGKGEYTQRIELRSDLKTNCLTTVKKDNVICYLPEDKIDTKYFSLDEIEYRYLTPTEYERLQTFPDNYTDCISNSQRFKALGNGWTVDVIAHILSHLKK